MNQYIEVLALAPKKYQVIPEDQRGTLIDNVEAKKPNDSICPPPS